MPVDANTKMLVLATDGFWDEDGSADAAVLRAAKSIDAGLNPVRDPRAFFSRVPTAHRQAEMLLRASLFKAACRRNIPPSGIASLPVDTRRGYHDDMTVVVISFAS